VAGPAPSISLEWWRFRCRWENSIPGSLVTQSIGPFPNYLEALVDVGMGNLGEYVQEEGEVMAMNLSPNIFYISSCGDKCNCPLVGCIILFLFYENCGNG
jgi:hypothetical protein